MNEYLDVDFGYVEGDEFIVAGYVYLTDDGTDTPYRSVEFSGCNIPLDKRGDTDYVSLVESQCKQYIKDCSEEKAKEIIDWYLRNCEEI